MLDPRSLEVYVVTSGRFGAGRDHRSIALAAIEGGATTIQLRAPELADDEVLPIAADIRAWCRAVGVLFLVNDRIDVALRCGADGVHVGQDTDAAAARDLIGPDAILGVSAGDAREAAAAERAGADYLGVTVWSTPTKPDAVPRGLEGMHDVVVATSLPVVGIGGIFASNAHLVLEAGAAGLAVVSAVAAAGDPVAATRELVEVVQRFRTRQGAAG
jgi:thiamine-phosphate pyrophosphorylase